MPSSYSLGKHFESFIEMQLASGRYNDASEVLRDALRLMEERERRGVALDAAIERGLADIREGHTVAAEDAFDALEERYTRMSEGHREP